VLLKVHLLIHTAVLSACQNPLLRASTAS
jgi:hypothetical protein